MKPLDRIANMSVLTRAGVEKVFKFGEIQSLSIYDQIKTFLN